MGWREWAAEKKAAQPTALDQLRGAGRVIRQQGLAGGMSPLAIRRAAKGVRAERGFGTGEGSGGNSGWTSPVHGTTLDGRPVTVSFGTGARTAGHTLICDGHVDMRTFYDKRHDGKGHDHYLVDGRPAGRHGDRGRYSD